ncbi:hypothetical protein [Thalassomonas actiniarum]|uniref:Uncharacterized protein n=1 Tax=Thalassomonas actiniarum TaxID=485447 RepID=A0AAE9YLX5_9GAMM|nr:hypothetical protein [Thalassomonas actiniarum]WDD96734.1 hypothetical protein SG35_015250 [Thalassomonas actiniarum]
MTLDASIDKFPEFCASKDYEYLRSKGIGYIQALAANQWTDHNIHDPGITLLEMLSYAITDLGYKTDYAIEDILAERSVTDTKLATESGLNGENPAASQHSYFTPREILPCKALTINDWRKVIIDVPLIHNARLDLLRQSQPAIYRDEENSELSYTPPAGSTDEEKTASRLNIQGLYQVKLEFENQGPLGDLNCWRYQFTLAPSNLKTITLHFEPAWPVFFENALNVDEFEHLYFDDFTSISDSAVYVSCFTLSGNGLDIPIEVHIESPLEKTEENKKFIEPRLLDRLDDIRAYLQARIKQCCKTARQVKQRLHLQRPLCEDFVRFTTSEIEEIGICTDIEIRPDVDIHQVLANIYYVLENFITPRVTFYSLEEMQQMAIPLDHIFNGPLLQHGFIKDDDLLACQHKTVIHISDVMRELMAIDGIIAIRKLQLSKFFRGLLLNDGEHWCLPITNNRGISFNVDKSKIVLYKGLIPYQADGPETQALLEDLRALNSRSRLQAKPYDVTQPAGQDQQLGLYHSIQDSFSQVYGIGKEGLPPSASKQRHAQAKQLKGFLTVMDQILANYCAQLANLKHLFSLNPDIKRSYFSQLLFSLPVTYKLSQRVLDTLADNGLSQDKLDKLTPLKGDPGQEQDTFEAQIQALPGDPLTEQELSLVLDLAKIPQIKVPNLPNGASLVREFVKQHQGEQTIDWNKPASYQNQWQQYLLTVKEHRWQTMCERDHALESAQTYQARKNRFLDHLLARFGEQFTDYVLLSTQLDGVKAADDIIRDKIAFLQELPVLSAERGQGFNYLQPPSGENVSGLEKRASRLAGIDNWQRKSLLPDYEKIFATYPEIDDDDIEETRFHLQDPNPAPGQDACILFHSTKHYTDLDTLEQAMASALYSGLEQKNYKIDINVHQEYFFCLLDQDKDIIAVHKKYYRYRFEVEQVIDYTIAVLKNKEAVFEGFHLIEHTLLRPFAPEMPSKKAQGLPLPACSEDDIKLFKVSLNEDCSPGYQDPYSFRVTAVVPCWLRRFASLDFRRFFEQTLRQETPAHIHIKICWVDQETMAAFEPAFFNWLEQKRHGIFSHGELFCQNHDLIVAQNKLMTEMEKLNSHYPQSRLFMCNQDETHRPIVLNHSQLGEEEGK